jgi:hypothetical protein
MRGSEATNQFFIVFKKTPHHLTFPSESPLFAGLFAREVFGKEVTHHLT